MPKSLASFQDDFQRAILEGDVTVLDDIAENAKEDRRVLLGVYQNAYISRLIEFLENDYEKLFALLGDAQFEEMASVYVRAHPSNERNARWFGTKLPQFLKDTEPYSAMPVLADIASLERALADVFDATDAPIISLDDLAAVAPQDWPKLTFTPHPGTRRFDISTNADDIWSAIHDEEAPPEPQTLSEPRSVVVYRPGGMATFRVMAADEAMMWDEASKGVTFSVLCEMLAMFAGEDEAPARAAGYLQGWITSEMLTNDES